jgi:hypothetical protein
MNMHSNNFRDLAAAEFDTTTLLAHAAEQAIERRYEDFCIVDVDCHHYETEAFNEILQYMEDPVLRHEAKYQGTARGGIASADGSYQEIAGRITRYPGRRIEKVPPTPHRDITLMRRWMDAMGVDIACMFPTPMLISQPARGSRSRSAWRRPTTAGSATRSWARRIASSRCSICRSTIPRPATRRSWSSPTARASSASW